MLLIVNPKIMLASKKSKHYFASIMVEQKKMNFMLDKSRIKLYIGSERKERYHEPIAA